MTIVVDASVAVKWVVDEPGSDAADLLQRDILIAPSIWLGEAANALWKLARRGKISQAEATERFARLRRAPVKLADLEGDTDAALDLAHRLDHPVYDCLYLALALREGVHVITADRRFHGAVERSDRFRGAVRMLGELNEMTDLPT